MKKILVIAIALCALVACDTNNNVNNNTLNNTNNQQEVCSDNIDNDLDGAIDCADPDCIGNAACLATDCGNGLIDPDEECDGQDLNGASCESLQMGQGTLTCVQCAFDTRGCGNNALKIYQSGTRMKMRVGTSPDGSKDFRGWYDSQLDINCVFRRLTTGQTRCIPELTSLNDRVYSDNICTIRAAALPEEDENMGQFTHISMEVSSNVFSVFQITGRIVQDIYFRQGTMCTRYNGSPAGLDVYAVIPVDMSEYQGQVETIE